MSSDLAIRLDANPRLGTGHLHCCTRLVAELRDSGLSIVFIMQRPIAETVERLTRHGHQVLGLPAQDSPAQELPGIPSGDDAPVTVAALHQSGAQLLMVYHCDPGAAWERSLGTRLGIPIAAIDGLANLSHKSDLVIDATPLAVGQRLWFDLCSPKAEMLANSDSTIIPQDFGIALRSRLLQVVIRRMLASSGVGDDCGLFGLTVEALSQIDTLQVEPIVLIRPTHPSSHQATAI